MVNYLNAIVMLHTIVIIECGSEISLKVTLYRHTEMVYSCNDNAPYNHKPTYNIFLLYNFLSAQLPL